MTWMPEPETGPDPTGRNRSGLPAGGVGNISDGWFRIDEGLQIRGGGAVAVDTATLSEAAVRFDAARAELGAIDEALGAVQHVLRATWEHSADAAAAASTLRTSLDELQTEAEAIAAALREAACAYEIVEVQAAYRAAIYAGDFERAMRLDTRVTRMSEEHPEAWRMALGAQFGHAVMWPGELVRQATQWGVGVGGLLSEPGAVIGGAAAGLLTIGGALVAGGVGTGRLSRDARLSGAAGPVAVTPVRSSGAASTTAPPSLAAATTRVPGEGAARVRVEKYTMHDGSRRFAVYVAGMQSPAIGGDDPWDNQSNLELYTGQMSDSYAATEQALAAAGAEPGDELHVFGFSQGAMIGAHLALESDYDVQTLVSLGSPVDADVGPGTLSVAVRHTDDPVAGLAGGGHADSVGASGSFVAERVFDPDTATDDATLPAHRLNAYAETAAQVDASSDPRVGGLRDVFDTLGEAESVEATEYAAVRRG